MDASQWALIKHFSRHEFLCPCCGKEDMEFDFLYNLDRLRETVGHPLIVNSGWRCPKHNAKVGGKSNSAHLLGIAADVRMADSRRRYNLIDYGMALGFTRFGIGPNYIHLDRGSDLTGHPGRVIWMYYSAEGK